MSHPLKKLDKLVDEKFKEDTKKKKKSKKKNGFDEVVDELHGYLEGSPNDDLRTSGEWGYIVKVY